MSHIAAYPLTWPAEFPRSKQRQAGSFKTSLAGALKNVEDSLRRFTADSQKKTEALVISSNVSLGSQRPADPGVAVWFQWDGLQVCIPVDRYQKVEDNLQAIHHILEARRTELRHGGLAIVRATFTGFKALPAPNQTSARGWRAVLGFDSAYRPDADDIEEAYKRLRSKHHPDKNPNDATAGARFHTITTAYEQAKQELGQ